MGIIALNFYDDVTEGFALSLGKLATCYFKLIAWNEKQDQRLFVVIPVSRAVFDAMSDLLPPYNGAPLKNIRFPERDFDNPQNDTAVNKLIESCQADLKSEAVLVLRSQVDDTSSDIFTIDDSLISSVKRAMRTPENLDHWLCIIPFSA